MGHVIAVSGKGGVGKTTLCGLLIQYLCESGKRPVLAVDADANANLNEVLGVEPEITLGELREEIERAGVDPRYQIPSGMTKQAYLEMRLSDAIVEEETFRILSEAIEKLPTQMRAIMQLALEGKKNAEIAERLNVSPETVHTLKKVAYKKLRAFLTDYYYCLLLFI